MRIVTNTPRFPERWRSNGMRGESVYVASARDFLAAAQEDRSSILLVNCDPGIVWQLAWSLRAEPAPRLVALDLVLREPHVWWRRLLLRRNRALLKRVDHFLNYFSDCSGLQRVYGIAEDRCSYIPFKANLPPPPSEPSPGEGDYVLAMGRSLRDFDTFFEAIEMLPAHLRLRAAIAEPDLAALKKHGARFSRRLDQLPAQVERLPDSGGVADQIRMISGARIVVLPIRKGSLVASGISTCLNAMRYGKCVIASSGPGVSDILSQELIEVPQEDPEALSVAIQKVWSDDVLRIEVAARGLETARRWGGEIDLNQRIIDRLVALYGAEW